MNEPGPRLTLDIQIERGPFRLDARFESQGGVVVLFGPSGAGKSTTLQAIAGLITPRSGEIILDGETLFRRRSELPKLNVPARKRRAGYVFQDYALFPHLTALENVAYPLWPKAEARARALDMLERVGLHGLAGQYPRQLSGGQQQRVAIARALITEPKILLLDEPFAALDLDTRRQVRAEIREILRRADIPTILVTHDTAEALALGDRLIVLGEGRVMAEGNPLEVLGHPRSEPIARLTGVENILTLRVEEHFPREGTTCCSHEAQRLQVPLTGAAVGSGIVVGLRASDILLATEKPRAISAQNVLEGRVTAVHSHETFYKIHLDCGFPLVSHITRPAIEQLGIRPGVAVWAVIKATACHVLADGGGSS